MSVLSCGSAPFFAIRVDVGQFWNLYQLEMQVPFAKGLYSPGALCSASEWNWTRGLFNPRPQYFGRMRPLTKDG